MTVMPMATHVSVFLPNLRSGGAERVNVNLANELAARGHTVDLVLISAIGTLQDSLASNVNVIDLQSPRVRQALWPLIRYLRAKKPDVLLANMWPLTAMALLARRMSGVKTRVVVAEHTTWSRSELLERPTVGWQVRTSMRHLFPKADGIVTVSHGAADDLAAFAGLDRKTVQVIYNPVVGPLQQPQTCGLDLEPLSWWRGPHKRVLAVGTLKAIKDYGNLLEAIATLRRSMDVRLLILGEGGCRAELEAQVQRLGLQGSVFLPGFVAATAPYYQKADLHVLSSRGEGLPTVLIEALAAGIPVVSTDCPSGPREILADGQFGRLVPVGNIQALAEAMRDSLLTGHDFQALRARAQDFSIQKAVDKYEALLCPDTSIKGAT